MEINGEWTVGAVFEDISERIAAGRSRALMGERDEALAILQCARLDYLRFQEALEGFPGSLSLEHSLETALAALCDERTDGKSPSAVESYPAFTRLRGGSKKAA